MEWWKEFLSWTPRKNKDVSWTEFISLTPEKNKATLLKKIHYLRKIGLGTYEEEAIKLFGVNHLSNLDDDQIIAQILPKSFNEYLKKITEKSFYKANSICFLKTIKWILSDDFVAGFKKYKVVKNNLRIFNYYHLIDRMLFDAILLLREYELKVLRKEYTQFQLGRFPALYDIDFIIGIEQLIFGQSSAHSTRDRVPDLAADIIRHAVETKIRKIVGAFCLYDKIKNVDSPTKWKTRYLESIIGSAKREGKIIKK